VKQDYIRCETVKEELGWCVRVVESEVYVLAAGAKLMATEYGLFDDVCPGEEHMYTFSSRAKARAALRRYKKRLPFIKVIGGLH
jgi:hypothetical protein